MSRGLAFSRSLLCIVTVSVAGIAGCENTSVYPVKGKLLIGGQPAGGADVVFHSVDKSIVSRPVALTEADGSFRLMTHVIDDGAPAGDYIVTVFWRDESMPIDNCEGTDLIKHDRLHGRYFFSTKSTLRATVQPQPTELVIRADGSVDDSSKK